jgi:hypothetical protein
MNMASSIGLGLDQMDAIHNIEMEIGSKHNLTSGSAYQISTDNLTRSNRKFVS